MSFQLLFTPLLHYSYSERGVWVQQRNADAHADNRSRCALTPLDGA
ncbi:MAG: hypothetical protein ABI865_08875 [Nitrosospira sp.]